MKSKKDKDNKGVKWDSLQPSFGKAFTAILSLCVTVSTSTGLTSLRMLGGWRTNTFCDAELQSRPDCHDSSETPMACQLGLPWKHLGYRPGKLRQEAPLPWSQCSPQPMNGELLGEWCQGGGAMATQAVDLMVSYKLGKRYTANRGTLCSNVDRCL